MHELGITHNIVAIAVEHSRGARVKRVCLEIGKLTAILPDSIRFCFDICCEGTLLAGAKLEIIEIPGLARCRHCQTEIPLEIPYSICPACDRSDLEILQGEELKIKELEIE